MGRWRPGRWVIGVTTVTCLGGLAVLVGYRIPLTSERLRRELIATLSERLVADVELGALELHLFPRIRIVGRDLTIRHRTRPDVRLIQVRQFAVAADLSRLLRKHVSHVQLDGLAMVVPPRDGDREPAVAPPPAADVISTTRRQLVIDELIAADATLTLVPREPGKRPKTWRLHELRLTQVGLGRAMPFHGVLTNAVPPGEIATSGRFGPWNARVPALTPVAGDFTFERADLSVFRGISGTLAAHGSYEGWLGQITTRGDTFTPDFLVSTSGRAVALRAAYQATVDGTNGDTTLDRIDASFLDTSLVASGGVYDVSDVRGRLVTLDVRIDRGRLEDLLTLAVPTPQPTMTGGVTLQSLFTLPPGDRDVIDRLRLEGSFAITGGRFTSAVVQRRINTLSGRARTDDDTDRVVPVSSDFSGRFVYGDGRLQLEPVRFTIPGALVDLRGRYTLRSGALAFAGHLLMDAGVSQSLGGWKGLLVKPFDPLFRRNGRTFVPLTIGGTRASPRFGVDLRRVFDKDAPARPPGGRSPARRSDR